MTDTLHALRPERVPGVPLSRLAPGSPEVPVTGVTLDSRAVLPGDLYVALPGAHVHGAQFVDAATAAGAIAVLTDARGGELAGHATIPVLVTSDPRHAMATAAAEVYGHPGDAMALFGLTGTNGKTSTTFLLQAALEAIDVRVGTIGTLGFWVGKTALEGSRSTITTPEAPDLQALLALMRERGAHAVAIEVSSVALDRGRVDELTFAVSGFTMFGQDHLDFHGDLESYYRAKTRLFLDGRSRAAVVNIDDPAGMRLAGEIRRDASARLTTTGTAPEAEYRLLETSPREDGSWCAQVATPQGRLDFVVGMLGDFNVRNALTALAMVGESGGDVAHAAKGLAHAAVPGRMQRLALAGDSPNVLIDFAHTPQAVSAALAALPPGRRIAVLGCGGDRDATKRGPMGAAAARGADVVIVTDDNPRSETPLAIREAVLAGALAEPAARARSIRDGGDRRGAIESALREARPGDWVAILGKGHERGQTIGTTIHAFEDATVVRELWSTIQGA